MSDMEDLDSRLLIEPAAVVVHAVEKAKEIFNFKHNSYVLVQGCGPIGLLLLATVRTMGCRNIIASTIWHYVRRGGSMCELGFFVNNGDAVYNPHLDICNKEIKVVSSWTCQTKDWLQAMEMLKEAMKQGWPVGELVSHKFPLDEINEAMETNIRMGGLKIAVVNS